MTSIVRPRAHAKRIAHLIRTATAMPGSQIPPIGVTGLTAVCRLAGVIFIDRKKLFAQHASLERLGDFRELCPFIDRALDLNQIDRARECYREQDADHHHYAD